MLIENTSTENILRFLSLECVNVLFVAEHSPIDIEELIARCNESGIVLTGGVFPMVISDEKSLERGIILKQIKTKHPPYLIKDISEDFIQDLPDLPDKIKSSFVLLDGLSPNIPNFMDSLYEKYWNKISYIGGGAGSLSLVQKPCIFTNEGFYENAGMVLMTEQEIQLGVKHGWEKIAGPYVANKADGNKIIELNWRPAFEVYKEIVEQNTAKRFDSSAFFDIAKGFPFGIFREGQEDIVRDPIALEDDGVMVCVGRIEQNTSLNILKGQNEVLIDNARLAAKHASNPKASDLFMVDCISRILYLEGDFVEELKAVKQELAGSELDLEGVLSIGEVSSGVNGYLEFYNKTTVVSSLY